MIFRSPPTSLTPYLVIFLLHTEIVRNRSLLRQGGIFIHVEPRLHGCPLSRSHQRTVSRRRSLRPIIGLRNTSLLVDIDFDHHFTLISGTVIGCRQCPYQRTSRQTRRVSACSGTCTFMRPFRRSGKVTLISTARSGSFTGRRTVRRPTRKQCPPVYLPGLLYRFLFRLRRRLLRLYLLLRLLLLLFLLPGPIRLRSMCETTRSSFHADYSIFRSAPASCSAGTSASM